jgi:hypothetical protein
MHFFRKPKTISFDDGKRVLESLLTDVGEHHWRDHISRSSVTSFRQLLGGMGSLNDLIICRANSHRITDEDDPRANTLLGAMIGVCTETSTRGPMRGEDAARRCVGVLSIISGSRCLACGHSFCGSRQVSSYLTANRLHGILSDDRADDWPVGRLLNYWHSSEVPTEVSELMSHLQASGIETDHGDGWMRPCHSCGSDDTCVYRWRVAAGVVEPTSDNLKLRKK